MTPKEDDDKVQEKKPNCKGGDEEEKEEEGEFILRVHGTGRDESAEGNSTTMTNLVRKLSRSFSSELDRRRRASLKENLPQTYSGWTVLISTISAMVLRYELRLQKSLTCPPVVYGQVNEGPLKEIFEEMTKSETSILVRSS